MPKRHCGFCNSTTYDEKGALIHADNCTAPAGSRLAEPDSDAELKFQLRIGTNIGRMETYVGDAVRFSSLNAGDMADIARTEAHLSRLFGVAVKIETAEE